MLLFASLSGLLFIPPIKQIKLKQEVAFVCSFEISHHFSLRCEVEPFSLSLFIVSLEDVLLSVNGRERTVIKTCLLLLQWLRRHTWDRL